MKRIMKIFTVATAIFCGYCMGASAQSATLKLWTDAERYNVTADGKSVTYITFYENDAIDYVNFQMAIPVPEGVKIAQKRSGREYVNDITLNADRATTSHTISCNLTSDGKFIKLGALSSEAKELYPDDVDGNPIDELFTIGIVAGPETVNGEYEVEVTDCKFILADEYSTASAPSVPCKFVISVTGGSTPDAIRNVNTNTLNDAIYDLNGRRTDRILKNKIIIKNGKKVNIQ